MNEFINRLSSIKAAKSVTGVLYHSIQVKNNRVEFIRQNKTEVESIRISELFEFFTKEEAIKTTIAKKYISGRVQSPAVAILNQIKSTNKINTTKMMRVNQANLDFKQNTLNVKLSDEERFFSVFAELSGEYYLLSKRIGKPISSCHIYLSNDYSSYNFSKEINDCYQKILSDLKSNKDFDSRSLSHNIDCLIINHPILKSRIVEFDEEQHFTPARLDSIKHLKRILPDNYISRYAEICKDKNYLDLVLKKHRLKNIIENVPKSFIEFTNWLEQQNEKSSGYIKEKKGFEFLGGRIAQRAYYDCLRDTAHLSERNINFESPLRFAKKTFEDIEKKKFKLITDERLKEIIIEILYQDFKIVIPNT